MPRDRLSRRALVVSTAVVLLAVSTGCLRSSIVRPSVEPISGPSSSVPPYPGVRPVPGPSQASAPTPTPTSNPAPIVPSPLPVTPPNPKPSPPAPSESLSPAASLEPQAATSTQPAVVTPAAAPTPLLDAALERVEAVNHLEDEPLDSSPTPAEPAAKDPPLVPNHSTAVVSKAATDSAPIPISIAARTTQTDGIPKPTRKNDALENRPKAPIPPLEKKRDAPSDTATDRTPTTAEAPSAIPPLEKLPSLGVSELHLCRKVHGFGSFEPLNATALKSGQRLLLYCEVTGLEYQPKERGFLSRLSSRIEIKAADSGLLQSEQELGSAEELFGRRRRDNYVNYVIELPKSLPPGNYSLKLIQTDLVANRSTSAEIPLQIVP
jgi:hypothetical protein